MTMASDASPPVSDSGATPRRATAETIVAREAEHFGAMAADWWNPNGSSAMLHRLNPIRLRYIRDAVDAHWGGGSGSFTPLAGHRVLDVGCGAGLLCEPLARLGAEVTGIDAALENIAAARAHAAAAGLVIDYRAGELEQLAGERFGLVTCLEVIEHVAARGAFVRALADRLAPGGLMILSTPNRTAWSRLALVGAAEATGLIPRGTHDWDRFVTPEELTVLLASEGLRIIDTTGVVVSPGGFALGRSTALNYIVTARFG